jgi:hypothetical protein
MFACMKSYTDVSYRLILRVGVFVSLLLARVLSEDNSLISITQLVPNRMGILGQGEPTVSGHSHALCPLVDSSSVGLRPAIMGVGL